MVRGNDPKDGPFINNSLQYPLAAALQAGYQDHFKHVVRASWTREYILSTGNKNLSRTGVFMDLGGPEMLGLKMERGSLQGLREPYSIIISSSTARALFGQSDPLEQTVVINNKTPVKVTGVYEDLPQNTQFTQIKFFSTWNLFLLQNDWIQKRALNDWNNHFLKLYAEIRPGMNFKTVETAIEDIELQNISRLEGFEEQRARNPKVFA